MELSQDFGRKTRWAGLAVLTIAALSCGAQAQVTDAQKSAIRSNCRSDFMSKCSGVTPGGREALECLKKNLDTLSPGCKTAVNAIAPPPPAAAPAPPPAATAPPPPPPPAAAAAPAPPAAAVPPPQEAATPPAAPPPPKKPAAAPAPKQAVTAPPPPPPPAATAPPQPGYSMAKIDKLRPVERLRIVRACDADRATQCHGVEAGGSRIIVCLAEHATALSPVCRKAIEPLLVAPAAMAPPPPAHEAGERPFTRGAALIAKACARYIALHCQGIAPGGGREAECLVSYAKSGHFVGPRCREVLKLTGHLN